MKTVEQMFKEKQAHIAEAIKKKEVRQNKTELSIGFRWAINVAVAFLPEKLKGTQRGFNQIKKWAEKFMDFDREYMLANMPLEPEKLSPEEIKQKQSEQDLAQIEVEEIQEDEKLKKAEGKAELAEQEYFNQLEEK